MGMTPDMPMVPPWGMPMDMPMATTALTYEALANRLGVAVNTVKRMANRHRWRKTRDNHGRALVHVPDDYLAHRDAIETTHRARQGTADGHAHGDASGHADGNTHGHAPRHIHGDTHAHVLMTRLGELERELAEMARKLGAAEADTANNKHTVEELRVLLDEMRQDRDVWRAQAERLTAAEGRAGAAEERAEGLQAVLDVERRQASELRQDRNRALEQLERAQAAHVAELTALHKRMAKAEHDRDRLAAELDAHLRRPWWRRLFA